MVFALVYLLAVVLGAALVHAGSAFALERRDSLIAGAQSGPILRAFHSRDRLSAALLDFGANLLAASANTISGLTIIVPYPVAAYRGWVVGIVSVDSMHASRLADPWAAMYYLITVVMQLVPYSLAGGAGVNLGMSYRWPRPCYEGDKWLGLPMEAVRDTLRIYLLVVPMFLAASLWEFLAA